MPKDAPQTKDLLLAAAREEFAAHGIAGARVDRIATRAGVNKERIYSYFGNKEKLFDEVVTGALDELVNAVPLTGAEDPVDYVGQVFDFHRNNPTLVRLFLWEALHYREHPLPNEAVRATRYRQKVAALATALGVTPSEDVSATLLILIGLAAWPNAVPQLARLIMGATGEDGRVDRSMRSHVIDFARRALTNVDNCAEVSQPGTRHALETVRSSSG